VNLARLNHILIPPTKEGRDRLRDGWLGRLGRPGWWLYEAFSPEGRALAVLTLLLGAAALDVESTRVYLLWAALCGALLGALVVRVAYRLPGVRIELRVPARVVAGEPVRFEVLLHNAGPRTHDALRVCGPFLPWDGRWLDAQPVFPCVAPAETVRGEVRARFVDRGEHHLDVFSVAALVPFGLAMGRSVRSEGCRFRVVPRIAPVEGMALPQGQRYQPGGMAQASRTGEALELVGVRPYRRGDPIRDLHALTWARTGMAHVREYHQEYFSRIGVIVDNDRSVTSEDGLEATLSLAAGIVACLGRGESLIDLLVVEGQVHPLTLGRSLGTLEQALDLLSCVRRGTRLDPDDLLCRLEPFMAELSCLVLVTEADPHGARPADQVRSGLVAAIEARGLPCQVVRVARQAPRTGAAVERGRVVAFDAIRGEAALWL